MFDTEYRIIGLNILKHRRLKNLTQEKLSEISGISRARISDIERGKGPYNFESLLLIARALGVDYIFLIRDMQHKE